MSPMTKVKGYFYDPKGLRIELEKPAQRKANTYIYNLSLTR